MIMSSGFFGSRRVLQRLRGQADDADGLLHTLGEEGLWGLTILGSVRAGAMPPRGKLTGLLLKEPMRLPLDGLVTCTKDTAIIVRTVRSLICWLACMEWSTRVPDDDDPAIQYGVPIVRDNRVIVAIIAGN